MNRASYNKNSISFFHILEAEAARRENLSNVKLIPPLSIDNVGTPEYFCTISILKLDFQRIARSSGKIRNSTNKKNKSLGFATCELMVLV